MFKGLQKNARRHSSPSPTIRPIELILDNSYTGKAAEFVRDAQTEIRLCAYAWRWYDTEPELGIQKLNIELLRAQLRGVQVRCLVDTEHMTKTFATLGFNVRSVVNTRMLHTKAIVVDQKTLIVGSHNLTKRANTDNYECSVAVQEPEAVLQFIDYFDRMWISRG